MRIRAVALLAVIAAAATLASSTVPASVHLVYPGTMDCERGCDFVAAGWPWPYLVDCHGISVVGAVSLSGGLVGEDILRPGHMAASFLFWLALAAGTRRLAIGLRRRQSAIGAGQPLNDA